MTDTTKLLLIIAVAVYGFALAVAGIASAYRAAKIRAIEQRLAELNDTIDSLQKEAEQEKSEPKRIRSMWGNHG